jgi:hypothetical protein
MESHAFTPDSDHVGAHNPLPIEANPFSARVSGARIGRPLQTAFGGVIRNIGLETRIVVVLGSSGTGKSLLMDMVARACSGMGLSVRSIERGDLLHAAAGEHSDVLLIDEADSMSNSTLQALLSARGKAVATTTVFLCLPSCVSRLNFSGSDAAVFELSPLSLSDARTYLLERANSIGRPHLFTPEALDMIIDGSRGLPRLLRSIASLAFFRAACEETSRIGANHVEDALAARVTLDTGKTDDAIALPEPPMESCVESQGNRRGSKPAVNRLPVPFAEAEPEKSFSRVQKRPAGARIRRLTPLTFGLAASLAFASGFFLLLLMGSNPDSANRRQATAPTAPQPAALAGAVVPAAQIAEPVVQNPVAPSVSPDAVAVRPNVSPQTPVPVPVRRTEAARRAALPAPAIDAAPPLAIANPILGQMTVPAFAADRIIGATGGIPAIGAEQSAAHIADFKFSPEPAPRTQTLAAEARPIQLPPTAVNEAANLARLSREAANLERAIKAAEQARAARQTGNSDFYYALRGIGR